MSKAFTTQEFIRRAKEVHGNSYDYSKVEYISTMQHVIIVCPLHGEFRQRPNAHISHANGCPTCAKHNRGKARAMNTQQFIVKARMLHGDKYDYSKVEYVDTSTKVCIICPIHGEFWQRPNDHLTGHACRYCHIDSTKELVYGVGINDTNSKKDKCYKHWSSMLSRCYSEKYHAIEPTYIGCSVCEEWIYLSKFKQWFEENYSNGYQLDKDIIYKGNRVYSPKTCCFVPRELNTLFHSSLNNRTLPIGVGQHGNRFRASIVLSKKRTHLGLYPTAEQAFLAYKNAKEKYI